MRTSAISAAAVLSSVALLAVGAPTASQAATQKELNLCWVNDTVDKVMDLEVVADGPSYKSMSLDAGECMAWDVQPGQYKITVEDVREFLAAIQISAGNCKDGSDPDFRVTIRRMQDTYKAWDLQELIDGSVETNVKKDRRTTVVAHLQCNDFTIDNPQPPPP